MERTASLPVRPFELFVLDTQRLIIAVSDGLALLIAAGMEEE